MPREDVVGRHVGGDRGRSLRRIEARQHGPSQLLLARQRPQPAMRSVGHDGRLGTEELRRGGELVTDDGDVDGEVVTVETPRPRSVTAGIPEHSHPVPVVVRSRFAVEPAPDQIEIDDGSSRHRPHAVVDQPIASLHRPSGWSRSFVLAPLRALHLDQRLRPGARRTKRALTPGPHTGNGMVAPGWPGLEVNAVVTR